MTIKIALVYILIICYFIIERSLRKDKNSLTLKPIANDAGSSKILWLCGVINILLLIVAPIFNRYQLGYCNLNDIAWSGLVVMICGLVIRYWAAKILGKFYTRTLMVVDDQTLINEFPYNLIRHPGYLGTLLLEIGAGLVVSNWLILVLLILIGTTSRIYRIQAEEKMLSERFKDQYRVYSEETWRLVPFLY